MKATFEIELPEEQGDFDRMVRARDMYLALWDFSEYLVRLVNSDRDTVTVDAVRSEFANCLDERAIILGDLDG